MREIKFRGKRVDNGEWVYGDLIHNAFDGYRIFPFGIKPDGSYPVEVIPETVEQFTGLHDKNGQELYEGDILSQGTSRFIVKWDEKHAMYKCYFVGLDEHYCNLSDDYIRDYFSVIGNIHENPELLEVTK